MIYLRFAITDIARSDSFDRGTAEFMFRSDDARECTRLAVELLREKRCRALGIDHAWEGFAPEDFPAEGRIPTLFETAEAEGMSSCVSFDAVPKALTSAPAGFLVGYAGGK
jgi:hypothetical protein